MQEAAPVTVAWPTIDGRRLWGVAFLTFVFCDISTTSIGLRLDGVIELHPVAGQFFEVSVLGTMLLLKLVVFGGGYLLWKHAPAPHRLGIPLGLATQGVLVTAWNCYILGQVWML